MHYVGAGAPNERQQMHSKRDGKTPLIPIRPGLDLRVVVVYRHLGEHASVTSNVALDVAAKTKESKTVEGPLIPFLKDNRYQIGTRVNMTRAFVHSKILSGTGLWPPRKEPNQEARNGVHEPHSQNHGGRVVPRKTNYGEQSQGASASPNPPARG